MNAFRLPFDFDAKQMRYELERFKPEAYYEVFNPYLEPNTLMGLHLIEPIVENGLPVFKPNRHLEASPYLLTVLETFVCNKETFRVHRLKAGAMIRKHRDIGRNFEQGIVRVHIPVQTDDQLYTFLDGERHIMQAGECWYMNLDLPHEIRNESNNDRIHLVMDCLRNDWWDRVFESVQSKPQT